MGKRQRRRSVVAKQKAKRARINQENQAANRRLRQERLAKLGPGFAERQMLINAMTNWQRTKWQRAGMVNHIDVLKSYFSARRLEILYGKYAQGGNPGAESHQSYIDTTLS